MDEDHLKNACTSYQGKSDRPIDNLAETQNEEKGGEDEEMTDRRPKLTRDSTSVESVHCHTPSNNSNVQWIGGQPLAVWRPITSERPWKTDNRRCLTLMEIYAECKNQVELTEAEPQEFTVQVKPISFDRCDEVK